MKKTIMFVFMLLACLLVMPCAFAETEVEYPTVTEHTASDSLIDGEKPTVTGSGTDTITVTVDSGTYKILGAQAGVGVQNRPDGYTWVGLEFTMPENSTDVKIGEGSFTLDENRKFVEYFGFNDAKVSEAAQKKEDYKTSFTMTWKDKDSKPQTLTINLVVKSNSVVIMDKTEENKQVWNEDKYLETSEQIKLTIGVVYSGEGVGDSYTDYIYIDKGTKVPTEADLRKAIKEEIGKNYDVEGFYSDVALKTKFDFSKNKTFDENTTIYIKIVDAKKTQPSEANPKTGDSLMTYVAMASVAVIATLGTGLYLRKVNN